MDASESERQVGQMVAFILGEAGDKAEEIEARCLEDFNLEKLKQVQAAKTQIRNDYLSKLKQAETASAINRSGIINKSRLQKIEYRHQCLNNIKSLCTKELQDLSKPNNKLYNDLLSSLIVQGCLKLSGEENIVIKCRKEDETILKTGGIMNNAQNMYIDALKKAVPGVNIKPINLSLSNVNLPSTCGGGVILSCQKDSISVDNTLSTRLGLAMDTEIPAIRKLMFN